MNLDLSVQFAGRLKRLTGVDRGQIYETAYNLAMRHAKVMEGGKLRVRLMQKKEKTRQVPLFHCRANYFNADKNIAATGSEYGIVPTLNQALDKIQCRIIQEKEKNLRRYNGLNDRED
ncbi:hypothetical protein HY500_00405 [Candidatus Woesearchaeota archaeon]|nr:hypothetical protein [Candidatus Woesearchaeota archaeon]